MLFDDASDFQENDYDGGRHRDQLQAERMQRNNLIMDRTMQSAITDNNTQLNANEDCIKQAESLL